MVEIIFLLTVLGIAAHNNSFLYCFPYSYRSFTLLKALAKSNGNLFAIAFKSEKKRQVGRAIILPREPSKRNKELIPKRMQRGLRVITLQGAIEKSPVLLSKCWKFE